MIPGIYIARKRVPRLATGLERRNISNYCQRCGQPYSWRVSYLRQVDNPNNEDEDNRTRAMALFNEYRLKGVGPCCATPEHRNFISRYCGGVVYN